jgi:hypothetical protein
MKSATGPPRKYERFHPADFGPFPADFGSFLASDPAEPRCKRTCEHRQDSKLLLDSADQQRDLSVQRLIEVREHRAIVLEDPRSRLHAPFEDFVLIGVEGSGSSAVALTGIGSTWGGRPEEIAWQVAPGKGVWIEELEAELLARDLPRPRMWGFPGELPGFRMDEAERSLRMFLEFGRDARG